jgi:hypothetical protein
MKAFWRTLMVGQMVSVGEALLPTRQVHLSSAGA